MSTLHKCRLCLKLSRNKIHIFKDDFPKMIEILTGLKVDPNDDFPKNSCLDCANNVKISLKTKRQIIRSHKILLEEFLEKCKESNDYDNPTANLNLEVRNTDNNSLVKEDSTSSNLKEPCINKSKENADLGGENISQKTATLILRTVTRSHSKSNNLSESIVTNSTKKFEDSKRNTCASRGEDAEKSVEETRNENIEFSSDSNENKDKLVSKTEYSSDDSFDEPSSPRSDRDWTPDRDDENFGYKTKEKRGKSEDTKTEKEAFKTNQKASDGVFFVKKPNIQRKRKTTETVVCIKKKPKGRAPPTRVTCDLCKREVQSYWLQKHMETHEYNPVTCEFCGLISKSATALRHHVFYYHKSAADEYMCDQCGRSFRSKYRLNLHKKKEHGGVKDFECTTCGKKFYERMHLKRHVDKTHKNIRPYVCDFCGKCFKSRNHIKIHERIHSKEAPFTCHMCGESFKMKLTLRTHLKGVHNVQEVQKVFCDICKRGFASDLALKAHINSRIHETEKCQYCSEMFTREYMVNHLRDVHQVEFASGIN